MTDKIPLTVLVVTKNEEANLSRCLSALERFDEIIVVDSQSADTTADIARSFGVTVMPFVVRPPSVVTAPVNVQARSLVAPETWSVRWFVPPDLSRSVPPGTVLRSPSWRKPAPL